MNPTWQRNLGLLALVAATLTACSADPDSSSADQQGTPSSSSAASPAADAGPAVDPVQLTLGTGDAKDAPSAGQIRWFAHRVTQLTDGAVTIKPVYLAAGHVARFEPVMVQQAIHGDLDLAVVAARAWDSVGVRTLAPLQAPFVVTSDQAMARVVADPIRSDVLAGLTDVGVVGLSLWPEGLRHPFGFAAPLNEPGDYAGGLVRAPYSRATKDLFRSLGARTTNGTPDPSTQVGAESQYSSAPAGTATSNLVFFPKINVLVANAAVDASLTDEQRDALTQAADDTRAWVLGTMPTDDEAARTFCDQGGKIQAASRAQVDAMVEATQPVRDAMAADAVQGPILDEITQAVAGSGATTSLSDCGDPTDAEALAALNGDYTFTVTADAGRKVGVTDQDVLDNGSGHYTAHLRDGTWTLDQVYTEGPSKGTEDSGLGDYTVEGDLFTWYWSHEPGQNVQARVTVLPDGSLEFRDVVSAEGGDWATMATVHFSRWHRVD
jgi:TRAP-type C4-dicarboxylate transport system substrate-binding protein